jgi:hypothetical protein
MDFHRPDLFFYPRPAFLFDLWPCELRFPTWPPRLTGLLCCARVFSAFDDFATAGFPLWYARSLRPGFQVTVTWLFFPTGRISAHGIFSPCSLQSHPLATKANEPYVPPNLIAQFRFLQSFSIARSSTGQGHRARGSWVTSCFCSSARSLRGLATPATRLGLCRQCFDFVCGGCRFIDFVFLIDCGLLQVKPGCILELPDQKARGFLVLIALERLFLKHAHKVFGEIPMRT